MSYRTRNITIASGLALLAVVFMIVYVSKHNGSSNSAADVGKGLVSVLFAARDIPQGTPGSALQSGALVSKRVPANTVVQGAISRPGAVKGTVATQTFLAGQQVSTRGFGPIAASGVLANISGTERVVQLAGDKTQVLDGTLRSGDHVDILGTWEPVGCQNCKVSAIIVRNALVLKTSSQLSGAGQSNEVPIQLRLTDQEANAVFWMEQNGEWKLILRPVIRPRSTRPSAGATQSILRYLKQKGLIR